jgi:hypothetical protein
MELSLFSVVAVLTEEKTLGNDLYVFHMGYSKGDAAQLSIQALDIADFPKEAQCVCSPQKTGSIFGFNAQSVRARG